MSGPARGHAETITCGAELHARVSPSSDSRPKISRPEQTRSPNTRTSARTDAPPSEPAPTSLTDLASPSAPSPRHHDRVGPHDHPDGHPRDPVIRSPSTTLPTNAANTGFTLIHTPKWCEGTRRNASRSATNGTADDSTPATSAAPRAPAVGGRCLRSTTPTARENRLDTSAAAAAPCAPGTRLPTSRLSRMQQSQQTAASPNTGRHCYALNPRTRGRTPTTTRRVGRPRQSPLDLLMTACS